MPLIKNSQGQAALTPADCLQFLRDGNERFIRGAPTARSLRAQLKETVAGQYPFAVILGCIDSRGPIETIFDQGIGDVFAVRVAGNVVGQDVLGSMEFACGLAGAKVVLVLGHTSCGAVQGAIARTELGNLTKLVQKIEPAVGATPGDRDANNLAYVDQVAELNVRNVLDEIRERSDVLSEMEQAGKIAMLGAMYNISTGKVRYL